MITDLLEYRKATEQDLLKIIELLENDGLGQKRENLGQLFSYQKAFRQIDADPKQYLMVIELEKNIIGSCHLTLLPSLTFQGATRMQIEAVRVDRDFRGQKIGHWMIRKAIEYGTLKGARIIQLMSDHHRKEAHKFYQSLGFKPSHQGFKYYITNE